MNPELTRNLLNSFYEAQMAFFMLPPLPEGLTPQYVHIIDAVMHIEKKRGKVRVSDVAAWFHISVPGATRSINALEGLGAVRKIRDDKDRRVVRIALTSLGREWYDTYLDEYHRKLSELLADIPESDAETTMQTIRKTVQLMRNHPIKLATQNREEGNPAEAGARV